MPIFPLSSFIEQPYWLLLIPIGIIALTVILRIRFIKIREEKELQDYKSRVRWPRIIVLVLRSAAIAMIAIALAYPFIVTTVTTRGQPHATILVDNSTSFSVFNSSEVTDLIGKLQTQVPVRVREICLAENSNIGDEIINKMQGASELGGESVLLVTDGQITSGAGIEEALAEASIVGSTVNALLLDPVESDYSVIITGPSQNLADTQNEFKIAVTSVGNPGSYSLKVTIGNQTVLNEEKNAGDKVFSVKRTLDVGYHRITATIDANDFFSKNNVYRKSIQIIKKPEIAVVSSPESPMLTPLKNLYSVKEFSDIPTNLSRYYAVILNDIPIDKINPHVQRLTDYVTDGNGLVVVGGKSSYDKGRYKGSVFEGLLPVRVGTGIPRGLSGVNVVMLIDASYSFRGGAVDYAKALALELIENARPQDKVGIVAFRSGGVGAERTKTMLELTSASQLSDGDKNVLAEDIGRITGGGGTAVLAGLGRAEALTQNEKNPVNVIIVTDGYDVSPRTAVNRAAQMSAQGYRIFVIGFSNGGKVNQEFLMDLADAGDGIYFEPGRKVPLDIIFDKGRDEGEDIGQREEPMEDVTVVDANHFITNGLGIDAKVTGYNAVVPRSAARLLLTTAQANPIVTSWHFGLGKVIAWSTDDGRAWSGELLAGDNARLLSRVVNFAIDDPDRKEEFSIDLEDTRVGEETIIRIRSKAKPEARGFVFTKSDEAEWTSKDWPTTEGFREIYNAVQAVNYKKEYQQLGISQEFREAISGYEYPGNRSGSMLDAQDVDEIVKKIKEDSTVSASSMRYVIWPFVLAGLIILMIEIVIRRIIENRRERR